MALERTAYVAHLVASVSWSRGNTAKGNSRVVAVSKQTLSDLFSARSFQVFSKTLAAKSCRYAPCHCNAAIALAAIRVHLMFWCKHDAMASLPWDTKRTICRCKFSGTYLGHGNAYRRTLTTNLPALPDTATRLRCIMGGIKKKKIKRGIEHHKRSLEETLEAPETYGVRVSESDSRLPPPH